MASNAGIRSSLFGKWHLGCGEAGARDTGWPNFLGTASNIDSPLETYQNYEQLDTHGGAIANTVYSTTEITQNAIDWIGEQGVAPWLCWVAYHAPHTPYEQAPAVVSGVSRPSEYDTANNNRKRFESMLWALDVEMERLISSVNLEETTVIIVGDNGTGGSVIDTPYSSAHSKGTLYDGGTRVPFYILGAAVNTPNVDKSMVMTADIYTTVLDLLGISSVADNITLDGKSLVPILEGTDTEERVAVVEGFGASFGKPGRMLRYGDYKLYIVDNPLDDNDTPSFELYHIGDDQDEQENLLLNLPLSDSEQAAYDFLLAKNAEIGGKYNYTPDTTPFFVELDTTDTTVPALQRQGSPIDPQSIVLYQEDSPTEYTATFIARRDASSNDSRYWVEIQFDPVAYGIPSGETFNIRVTFAGNGGRVFTALNTFTVL